MLPIPSDHSLYLIKIVEIQPSWEKLRTEQASERNEMNDLHASIATRLHENAPLSGTIHHLSGPDMFALTRGAVCVCVVCNVSVCALCGYVQCVGVWCVWCVWYGRRRARCVYPQSGACSSA